jgi:hypothetical protein
VLAKGTVLRRETEPRLSLIKAGGEEPGVPGDQHHQHILRDSVMQPGHSKAWQSYGTGTQVG